MTSVDAVLGPTPRYPLADLLTHHDLLGPRPGVLLGQLVGRVDPELAAVELRPGAWSSWSSGPSVMRTSRFGSTFAVTRKKTSA